MLEPYIAVRTRPDSPPPLSSFVASDSFSFIHLRCLRSLARVVHTNTTPTPQRRFDTTKPGELSTRIKGDTLIVKEGIGVKVSDRGGQNITLMSLWWFGHAFRGPKKVCVARTGKVRVTYQIPISWLAYTWHMRSWCPCLTYAVSSLFLSLSLHSRR